ncbi:hypothetical protein LOTGIDRAFT_166092 [Lottia gigantea]|uniref:Uncharacterized protein n=1 Tax=Lottia gigantea TaxID=225164 RepID=V3ZYT0_LOTGI|nr:hypothetical protein LOTGIDRAFT_166092 [Lottia gigantea]ESO87795.1 hypothetical protein LOTGIDRAFT_166092 [Lottia gigantea]
MESEQMHFLSSYQVNATHYSSIGEWIDSADIEYVNIGLVSCSLPKAGYYMIRASNNGLDYSNEVFYFANDRDCYNCNTTEGTCAQRDNECIIDEKCHFVFVV